MATTRDAVILTAPELAAYPDGDDWNQAIADAQLELGDSETKFGRRGELAERLLVAHLMTVRKGGGGGGQIQSESIGGVISRTYAAAKTTDADELGRSSYGLQLLRLMRVTSGGPRVT